MGIYPREAFSADQFTIIRLLLIRVLNKKFDPSI